MLRDCSPQQPLLDWSAEAHLFCAQMRGDAARVTARFQLTNDNYANSVALLKDIDRFRLSYKLVDAHFQALRDLPSPSNNLASLREFLYSTEGHIRSLASLEKPEDSYGIFLVAIIFGKLSVKTKQNLVRSNPKMTWSITELPAAILNIVEMGSEQQTPQVTPTASFHAGAKRSTTVTSTTKGQATLSILLQFPHPFSL